jgi:5-methylcytosine-specific restriction endonuclease McrA
VKRVTCCGCEALYPVNETTHYRSKRWCGLEECKKVIDLKVKHHNYKRKYKKIINGTYRNGVSPELREQILNRDSYCCGKCRSSYADPRMMQVHHIIPVSEDGSDDPDNLITVCKNCHNKIHNDDWRKYVETLQSRL